MIGFPNRARSSRHARWICVVWICFLSACVGGTETGNPDFIGRLAVNAFSSDTAAVGLSTNAGVQVEEAWVNLGAGEFFPSSSCENESTAVLGLEATGSKDHAGPDPAIEELRLEEDQYCRLALSLPNTTSVIPDGAPGELAGHAVVLTGTLATGTPFSIALASPGEAELRATSSSFSISEEQSDLFLGFDLAKWVGNVDLALLPTADDGVLRVDEMNNSEVQSLLEGQITNGLELYIDRNGDGIRDEGEDPLIASGEN